MPRRIASIVFVAALTSAARAQPAPPPAASPEEEPAPPPPPARFAVGLGLLVGGGGPSSWFYGAWTVEAGALVLRTPVRTRVRAFGNLAGGTIESDWGGDFRRFGAGLEVRGCIRHDTVCGFVDLDLGYQSLTLYDDDGDLVRADRGLLVGPRFGVDLGAQIRLRLAIEAHRQLTSRDVGSFGTGGLALALAYQF